MVPAATPKPIVERLNAEIARALRDPELRARLAAQGVEPLGSTTAEYGAYLKKEIARWGQVVKASGVKIE
jgi:tripartite-type tricarboxylate transporter receptor subunit TctC